MDIGEIKFWLSVSNFPITIMNFKTINVFGKERYKISRYST